MENTQAGLRQKVDNFFTNYLRQNMTDQEILDFYGEGNIIGRKGIPSTDRELLDAVTRTRQAQSYRPVNDRPYEKIGGFNQTVKYDYSTKDIPGLLSPETGRPWQMTFGALPYDFGSIGLTPAANQFLQDFRVPEKAGFDYSFATGPNIQDRIEKDIANFKDRHAPYKDKPGLDVMGKPMNQWYEEEILKYSQQSPWIGNYSGSPQTPRTWIERGYIKEKPPELKEKVLKEFQNRIFETQGPFGGTSSLTPVYESGARNPNWRSDLYETTGLAGPAEEISFSDGWGGRGSQGVQRFVTGNQRNLPLQPYTEFYKYDGTRPSVLGTKPAPDFTPFQKAVGTRNYLIGRNILEGRGDLGKAFRVTAGAVAFPLAGRLAGYLGPIGDAFDLGQGVSSAVNPQNKAGERTAGAIQAAGAAYGLGGLATSAAGLGVLPLALPVSIGTGVTAGSIRAAEAMKDPKVRAEDTRKFKAAMPATQTKGFNRNDPIPPGMGIAIKNGKPILVPKGSVAGNKIVGRPWWDLGQYVGN